MSKVKTVRNILWAGNNQAHWNHLHVDAVPKLYGTPPVVSGLPRTSGVDYIVDALTAEFGRGEYFQSKNAAQAGWTHMGWYNRRLIAGTSTWSQHSWGNALDIGPYYGVKEQEKFYNFLMGIKEVPKVKQLNENEVKELRNFLAFLEQKGSNVSFAKYIVDDIRKDIITRDELNDTIRKALSSQSGLELELEGKRLVIVVEDVV